MELEIRTPHTPLEWDEYYNLRFRVLRKPLNQIEGSERNEGDLTGLHFALYANLKLKAIARLDQQTEDVAQVRFVAVEFGEQGKGFGKLIMNAVEHVARQKGFKNIMLHARENALDFYLSQQYCLIEKSHLLFGQVQHFLMEKCLV